jgi:hypothetical protein
MLIIDTALEKAEYALPATAWLDDIHSTSASSLDRSKEQRSDKNLP